MPAAPAPDAADAEADRRGDRLLPGLLLVAAPIVVASSGLVPAAALRIAAAVQTVLLVAALAGLGTGIRLTLLRRTGGSALALGLASWVLVAGVAYAGVRLVRP